MKKTKKSGKDIKFLRELRQANRRFKKAAQIRNLKLERKTLITFKNIIQGES